MAHVIDDPQAAAVQPAQRLDGGVGADAIRVRLRRRLGWRLTASYAVVTVAVLLSIEMILLVGGTIYVAVSLDRNGRTVAADLRRRATSEIAPLLASGAIGAPDLAGIDRWLRGVQANGIVAEGDRHVQIRPDASALAKKDAKLLVLDRAGAIVGAVKQAAPPTPPASATTGDIPGLAAMLPTVLAGRDYSTPFYQWPPSKSLTVAVPVRNDAGTMVGALVFSARSPLDSSFQAIGETLAMTAVAIVVFGAVIGTISGSVAARQLTVRLDRVSDAASAWGAGDFSAAVADRSEDELGQLGRRLNRMAEQLADLIRAREQLSVVDERNRLARDLHDSVKQQAFAVSMHLGSARELWERDPGTARERLDAAYEIARQSQQELTAIIQTLRPIELADATFERALRDHLAQWQTRTGIVVDAQIAADAPLPHPVEDALFRVAQEALTNVARQSRASRVRVGFARGGDSAMLEIADDGTGFEVRRTRPGMGMQSMRERMESLGGTFALGSDAGGTRIDVRLPLKETGGM